jgi:hypothetical protein
LTPGFAQELSGCQGSAAAAKRVEYWILGSWRHSVYNAPILAKCYGISQFRDFTIEGEFRIDIIKLTAQPIELIVKSGDCFRVLRLNYYGVLRYPHLERAPSVPARLDDILAARK